MRPVLLGRFGDRRLEKGGRSCTRAWWRQAGGGCEFVGWAGIGWGDPPDAVAAQSGGHAGGDGGRSGVADAGA